MATFTANDKDIPTVDTIEQCEADAVLALIEERGEPDYIASMLGLTDEPDQPTGDVRGAARRHQRRRVKGVRT